MHRNSAKIATECPTVIREYLCCAKKSTERFSHDRLCQKLHAYDHKFSCGFRLSDNYENVGLPFIVSIPESQLTCQNVFEQIKIHAK